MRSVRRTHGGTFIDALSVVAFVSLVLGAFLYFPIAVDQMNLEALMGEVTLQKKRVSDEDLIKAFVDEAEREYDIILYEDDIEIVRTAKIMTLYVIWRPIITIPIIGYEFELEKELERQRVVLN
ncbi:MAG: hypothetical protein KDD46_03760 [Bdellovibrionales bacterium]|nr:hypothetical protein [Bdellovibrionales bacterium]